MTGSMCRHFWERERDEEVEELQIWLFLSFPSSKPGRWLPKAGYQKITPNWIIQLETRPLGLNADMCGRSEWTLMEGEKRSGSPKRALPIVLFDLQAHGEGEDVAVGRKGRSLGCERRFIGWSAESCGKAVEYPADLQRRTHTHISVIGVKTVSSDTVWVTVTHCRTVLRLSTHSLAHTHIHIPRNTPDSCIPAVLPFYSTRNWYVSGRLTGRLTINLSFSETD